MPRTRNIKPGFFLNEDLAACGPLGQVLYAGLWTLADRDGRLEDRPARIKAMLFPYYECDTDPLLTSLADAGFIERYEVDGDRFIQIANWRKHQQPHIKEAPSIIPPPREHQLGNGRAPEQTGVKTGKVPVNHQLSIVQTPDKPGINIPDSLVPHPSSLEDLSNHRARIKFSTRSPKTTAQSPPSYIAGVTSDFSRDLGDSEHEASNITQSLRLLKSSGLSEEVFKEAMYEARRRTRLYQTRSSSDPMRTKMAYFFTVLTDLATRGSLAEGADTS